MISNNTLAYTNHKILKTNILVKMVTSILFLNYVILKCIYNAIGTVVVVIVW